ncbi:unnamed protein product, partial [Prorocentrum cordatum]
MAMVLMSDQMTHEEVLIAIRDMDISRREHLKVRRSYAMMSSGQEDGPPAAPSFQVDGGESALVNDPDAFSMSSDGEAEVWAMPESAGPGEDDAPAALAAVNQDRRKTWKQNRDKRRQLRTDRKSHHKPGGACACVASRGAGRARVDEFCVPAKDFEVPVSMSRAYPQQSQGGSRQDSEGEDGRAQHLGAFHWGDPGAEASEDQIGASVVFENARTGLQMSRGRVGAFEDPEGRQDCEIQGGTFRGQPVRGSAELGMADSGQDEDQKDSAWDYGARGTCAPGNLAKADHRAAAAADRIASPIKRRQDSDGEAMDAAGLRIMGAKSAAAEAAGGVGNEGGMSFVAGSAAGGAPAADARPPGSGSSSQGESANAGLHRGGASRGQKPGDGVSGKAARAGGGQRRGAAGDRDSGPGGPPDMRTADSSGLARDSKGRTPSEGGPSSRLFASGLVAIGSAGSLATGARRSIPGAAAAQPQEAMPSEMRRQEQQKEWKEAGWKTHRNSGQVQKQRMEEALGHLGCCMEVALPQVQERQELFRSSSKRKLAEAAKDNAHNNFWVYLGQWFFARRPAPAMNETCVLQRDRPVEWVGGGVQRPGRQALLEVDDRAIAFIPVVTPKFDPARCIFATASDCGGVGSDDCLFFRSRPASRASLTMLQRMGSERGSFPLAWRACRVKRQVASTLARETFALPGAFAETQWLHSAFEDVEESWVGQANGANGKKAGTLVQGQATPWVPSSL